MINTAKIIRNNEEKAANIIQRVYRGHQGREQAKALKVKNEAKTNKTVQETSTIEAANITNPKALSKSGSNQRSNFPKLRIEIGSISFSRSPKKQDV